jgi:hypothetical protein
VGDRHHHRFWGQVVRWAAADKPLVAGNDLVRFGTREPVYRHKQPVDLVARLGEELGPNGGTPLPPDAEVKARVRRTTANGFEDVAQVTLARKEAQPRLLEGRLDDLPPGQYAVELDVPRLGDRLQGPPGPDGKPTPLRATFTVTGESEEMTQLATNWDLLEKLAAESGGRVFTPDNAAELIDLLQRRGVRVEHHTENRLWQWWVTLVLLLALLTVEWVGRKWAGLP